MTTFVSRSGRILAAVTIGVFGLALATTLTPATTADLARGLAVYGFLSLVVYAAFWRPRVEVSEDGIVVRNPISEHHIEWGAIARIDTKWGLTLYLDDRRVSVWAAPAPGRHTTFTATRDLGSHLPESTYLSGTVRPGDLISTESGGAAALVRRHWERRTSDFGRATRTLSFGLIGALVLFGVAAGVALSL